jgi:hypothetical protein
MNGMAASFWRIQSNHEGLIYVCPVVPYLLFLGGKILLLFGDR